MCLGAGSLWRPPIFSPLLKVEGILLAVPVDGGVKELAGVLGGAAAQSVEAQGVLVVVPAVAVLPAGVELAEHQLPVVAALGGVPVHRAAPAKVLHLDGLILVPGDDDQVAVALPGLVDGVGEDLKHRVLAPLQGVAAEDDPGPLAHPLRPLEGGDGFIAVLFPFPVPWCHRFQLPLFLPVPSPGRFDSYCFILSCFSRQCQERGLQGRIP